eukprot:Tbor_TRINITY_DN5567_c3_g1::TRINITY_DN5567_c3_g1_i1::g.13332::m.13332
MNKRPKSFDHWCDLSLHLPATTASLSPSCLSLHSSLYLVASDVPSADSGGATALRSLVGKCDLSLHVIDCLDDYILPLTLPVPHVASGVTPQVISQPPSLEYFIAYSQSFSTSSSRQSTYITFYLFDYFF